MILVLSSLFFFLSSGPPVTAAKWPLRTNNPAAVPPTFDCAMRKLAYKYGKQLLPRQGKFQTLFSALGLDVECQGEAEPTTDNILALHEQIPVKTQNVAKPSASSIYVDAVKGSDSNAGTEAKPLKTVQVALDKAGKGGNVVLRGTGAFYLSKSIMVGPQHSGITVSAYPNEKPVISGGKELSVDWKPFNVSKNSLKGSTWERVPNTNAVYGCTIDNKTFALLGKPSDADGCQALCVKDARCTIWTWHDKNQGSYANDCIGRFDHKYSPQAEDGHTTGHLVQGPNIYVADIKGQVDDVPGLQLDGVRATRARYPNMPGGIEVSCGYGCMVSGGKSSWTPPNTGKYPKVKFYTDTTTEHKRNNTPSGWFQEYMIGIGGLCTVYDPPVSYWCSEHPSGGGAFAFRTPSGMKPTPGALPHTPYKDVSEMIINVWRPSRWANWMFEVEKYDAKTNNFTFGYGGFQGARGHTKGGDWFVENVMEELDAPGEFFFDKKQGKLYLFYNGTGAPPKDISVVAPQVKVLMNVTGTQWNPVKNFKVDGVKFTAASYTYMMPHGVPSAGDWALERFGAIFLQGTEMVEITNTNFERLDGNGLMISGYNRNATVADSDFQFIGGNAIASWGYTNETEGDGHPQAGVDGTDGNHPRYTHVLRNLAREVGHYEKQSSFYIQAKTAQATIMGNVFFNGPRAGINANDGFGGGDIIANNLVFSTCRESGDHGPFNSWDRQPFLTTVRTGQPSMFMEWREIHHNFFIDNYSPQENVDNDDGSAYFKTHDNFFVYGNQGMKNDFGGHDNHHYNNIYAYAGRAMGTCGTLAGHQDYFYQNKAVLTGGDVGGVQCKGAAMTTMHDNQYFTGSGSITECGQKLADHQKSSGQDKGSTVSKTPSDGTIIGWAEALLAIK